MNLYFFLMNKNSSIDILSLLCLFHLHLMDVDKFGLDHIDRNILQTIIHKFDGGPVGLDTLAAAIGEDKDCIQRIYGDSFLDITDLNQLPTKLTSVVKRHIRV